MNHCNNRHHQQTSMRIQQAVLELLKGKEPEKITIREICASSGINSSTFYRHYLDIYDLMDKIADRIYSEVFALFEDYCQPIFLAAGVSSMPHMNYYYRYYISGFNAVIICWLEQGCPESPEELAGILKEMLYQGRESLVYRRRAEEQAKPQ